MTRGRNNYEYARQQAQTAFLKYDQEEIIRLCRLDFNEFFLFVKFAGKLYRICRETGEVESVLGDGTGIPGDYEETMTIYDVLCGREPWNTVGENWCLVNNLPGVAQNSGVGDQIKGDEAEIINENPELFCSVCRKLGGREIPLGDLGFEIPLFPFFSVRLRFYQGDEEFSPRLSVLFHDRTLDVMRYETTFYAKSCLLRTIREEMEKAL